MLLNVIRRSGEKLCLQKEVNARGHPATRSGNPQTYSRLGGRSRNCRRYGGFYEQRLVRIRVNGADQQTEPCARGSCSARAHSCANAAPRYPRPDAAPDPGSHARTDN
jgi:hypothetical protein